MFSIGRRGDELSLSNCDTFFDGSNIQSLLFFVNEVPLKQGFRQYDDFTFRKVQAAFQKGSQRYGVKIVRPLKTLVLRMLKENLGFVDLHVLFLKMCKRYSVYRQALPIIEYPALFKHATKNVIAEFLINGTDVYIKLRKYKQAWHLVSRGDSIDLFDNELEAKLIMRKIILGLSLGYGVGQQIKEKIIRMGSKEEHLKMLSPLAQKKQTKEDEEKKDMYDFFMKLDQYRPLTPQEEGYLKPEGLMELYEAGKGADLGTYIAQHVRKNNWRIKATQIQKTPVDNLQIIRGVNLGQEIYRYDCKNGIMYFNHKEADQEQLNGLITKAFNMSEEVVYCKVDREDRMGGMGGMRLGGMGGMGGMGMFSMMGSGMGRRGM